jgi:ribosome recycling factor
MERDKAISQDENRRTQDQLQKATDAHIRQIDEIGTAKEAEIMQV